MKKNYKILMALIIGLLNKNSYAQVVQEVTKAPASEIPLKISTQPLSRDLHLEIGKGYVLPLEKNVHEIFVANPEIADIQLNTPFVAYVLGKKAGSTTVFATDATGKVSVQLEVKVSHNVQDLQNILKTQFPNDNVNFTSMPEGIIMHGHVSSAANLKNIEDIVKKYLGPREQLINNATLAVSQQVLLKVKIAEVSRTVLNKFGLNWAAFMQSPAHFAFGMITGRDPLATTPQAGGTGIFSRGDNTNSIGFQFNDNVTNFTGILDALDKEGLASVLAEPNLMAISGETASFLAGGEYPYPVPQDQNITLMFKQFGISLAFTPTVRSNNSIVLHVRPEVSQLDRANTIKIALNSTSGTSLEVPSIITRRAETTVELGSGQSLAIAGLIKNDLSNSYSDLPGFADLPIFGALFRSTQFQRSESELIIIVTPYAVTPTSDPKALKLPTDTLHYASNLETLFLHRLNRLKGDNPYPSRSLNDAKKVNFAGAAGFYVR